MAAASYDSDLTSTNGGELTAAASTTNWAESTNGAWDDGGGPDAETDFYIQGTSCVSQQFTKTGVGTLIYNNGTFTVDTDGAILIWNFWASPPSLTTYANGGIRTVVGSGLGDFYAFKASGSNFEPNPFGGWYCFAVNPDWATTSPTSIDTTVGTPSGTWSHVGMAINATAQARGQPHAVDAIRVGRCTMEVTDGDGVGGYGTFSGMADFDTSTNQRYGVFQPVTGGYRWQGLMSLGLTGTSVDFRDSNANIVVANTPMVSSGFNKIEINNAASNVEWTQVSINSYGVGDTVAATNSPGAFEVVDNATVSLQSCTFSDMTTFDFLTNTSANDCTFLRCGLITAGGADLSGSTISDANVGTDGSALSWDVNSDPNGELDNMTFVKGTDSAHAIEFGTNVPTTMTLTGINFSGYNASNGQNDSTFYFKDASPTSITLNLTGCSGNFSYKTDGADITIVADPVATTITVTDVLTSPIYNARVLVEEDYDQPLPVTSDTFIASNSGIASTGNTTHNFSHGLTILPDDVLILDTVGATGLDSHTMDSPWVSQFNGGSTTMTVGRFYKIAESGEPSQYTFYTTASTATGWAIRQYRGLNLSDIVDVDTTLSSTGNGTTVTSPTISPSANTVSIATSSRDIIGSPEAAPTISSPWANVENQAANILAPGLDSCDLEGGTTATFTYSSANNYVSLTGSYNIGTSDVTVITRSGTTATFESPGHSLQVGEKVVIRGADQGEYNGVKTVTAVDSTGFSYTVNSPLPTTPATTSTQFSANKVIIDGTTDSSGQIQDTRVLAADLAINGRARKSTGAPYYRTSTFSGTIDSVNGLSINVQLLLDQ